MLDWLLGPPVVGSLLAGVLFVRGGRRHARVTSAARIPAQRRRAWAFWAALVTVLVALDPPIDTLAGKLFWVHMVQHVLLMMVAAPLLVLAAPWTPLWKGLSLPMRRNLARAYARSPTWRVLRRVGRWLAAPLTIWIVFDVDLCAWHVPVVYGATLRNQALHDLEHVSFLVLGVLFWAAVIDSPPLRSRLDMPWRIAFVTLGAVVAWLLAVVLAFARSPLYVGYAVLHSRPGGLSALTDQQLAAGIMWGPGSVPYALFVFGALYRWLAPGEPALEGAVTTPRAGAKGRTPAVR
jgi:putative membrane protein